MAEEKEFYITLMTLNAKYFQNLKAKAVKFIEEAQKGNILFITLENQIIDTEKEKKAYSFMIVIHKKKIKDFLYKQAKKLGMDLYKEVPIDKETSMSYFRSKELVVYDKEKNELVVHEGL